MDELPEFTDHYQVVYDGDLIRPSYADALRVAGGNKDRVWFVRHGDGCDCELGDDDWDSEEGYSCECEETWDVELANGQYVNTLGWFVTTEPCRPEHQNKIFTY